MCGRFDHRRCGNSPGPTVRRCGRSRRSSLSRLRALRLLPCPSSCPASHRNSHRETGHRSAPVHPSGNRERFADASNRWHVGLAAELTRVISLAHARSAVICLALLPGHRWRTWRRLRVLGLEDLGEHSHGVLGATRGRVVGVVEQDDRARWSSPWLRCNRLGTAARLSNMNSARSAQAASRITSRGFLGCGLVCVGDRYDRESRMPDVGQRETAEY